MLTGFPGAGRKLKGVKRRYKKKHGPRGRNFIAQWREHRGLNKRQLAERLDISDSQIGRYESGETPYNQDLIEDIAVVLDCDPADLISRAPGQEEPNGLSHAIAILETARNQRPRR